MQRITCDYEIFLLLKLAYFTRQIIFLDTSSVDFLMKVSYICKRREPLIH
jgi:hypothetical protein